MEFQILSHAGLAVRGAGKELVCDPWLVGSCYWRSWWNYPPVAPALVERLKPDAIYISHLHWDHFHGVSLKRFARETPVIVPYDRYDRMRRDLAALGFRNVIELPDGGSHALAPGFTVHCYHVNPVILDSALVIEVDGVVLLDANDAKLAGPVMDRLLARHPRVDFAFRSHSSANARLCTHVLDGGDGDQPVDDQSHYVRAFCLFMDRVRPHYAIPFASNSCYLHDDTWAFNAFAHTPADVAREFERFRAERGTPTELKVMVSGDAWSSMTGFAISPEDPFADREAKLAAYRERVHPALVRQAALEAGSSVPVKIAQRFFQRLSQDLPFFWRRQLRGARILFVCHAGDRRECFVYTPDDGRFEPVADPDVAAFDMRLEFPTFVFRQALLLNMFDHAGISKRVHYYATRARMPALAALRQALAFREGEALPITRLLDRRTIGCFARRWREMLLALLAGIDRARGLSWPQIEEKFLSPRRGR